MKCCLLMGWLGAGVGRAARACWVQVMSQTTKMRETEMDKDQVEIKLNQKEEESRIKARKISDLIFKMSQVRGCTPACLAVTNLVTPCAESVPCSQQPAPARAPVLSCGVKRLDAPSGLPLLYCRRTAVLAGARTALACGACARCGGAGGRQAGLGALASCPDPWPRYLSSKQVEESEGRLAEEVAELKSQLLAKDVLLKKTQRALDDCTQGAGLPAAAAPLAEAQSPSVSAHANESSSSCRAKDRGGRWNDEACEGAGVGEDGRGDQGKAYVYGDVAGLVKSPHADGVSETGRVEAQHNMVPPEVDADSGTARDC